VSRALSLLRASWASGVQEKCLDFLSNLHRGSPFSPRREMKRLREARHPMTLCTPFRLRTGPMFAMAETFSRLASIPHSDIINPRSMPQGTPKTHFLGLSLIHFALRHRNVSSRSATRPLALLDLTIMSST